MGICSKRFHYTTIWAYVNNFFRRMIDKAQEEA